MLILNGLMALFITDQFMSMADFDVTSDMHTLGQFMGVTFLIFGLIAWKTVDLAGDNLIAFGKVYALAEAMWVGIIVHVATGGRWSHRLFEPASAACSPCSSSCRAD